MSKSKKTSVLHNRLARNFHKTFVPERRYLHAILKFAARGGKGDIEQIAEETGIPTGKSSGKVGPSLDYCRGMGLIWVPKTRSSAKSPELTPFGRVALLEDPFLKEPLTQWIAHLRLCDVEDGAEIWYQTFFRGSARLGVQFSRESLDEWLASSCDTTGGGLIGPLVRMYEDEAAFKSCGVLSESMGTVTRRGAPIDNAMALGYGAWLVSMMESITEAGTQVTITELEARRGWRTVAGWNLAEAQRVLELVERNGILTVDRQMSPWILRAKCTSTDAWRNIYRGLI